ncbi:MAG: hypothetical protein Q8P59_09705 [Dehalococcoidia bacterium]|nr:hypothetical protein [Dehalococcoidia bacterium]
MNETDSHGRRIEPLRWPCECICGCTTRHYYLDGLCQFCREEASNNPVAHGLDPLAT